MTEIPELQTVLGLIERGALKDESMKNKHLFLIKAYRMYRNLGLHIEISKVKAYYLAREYGFEV